MKRRDFLKKTMAMGASAGSISVFAAVEKLFAAVAHPRETPYLVGVMGGEPGAMFDTGINALGGIRTVVKPNQTVVVKPNIGWDTEPGRAADTNPALIKQIVAQCLGAGAKKVYVFDHTADIWQKCYENSGIKYAVSMSGGQMVPGNNKRNYHQVTVAKGKSLRAAFAHELFLESDVFINVPVLKNHGATKVTIGMKNLMGVVWDRGWWHSHDLHQCIADFSTVRRPDLTVVDAYRVLKTNGPMGVSTADTVLMKAQIISKDPVAADAAATKLLGLNPSDISYIRRAHELGVGIMDLEQLDIRRIKMA